MGIDDQIRSIENRLTALEKERTDLLNELKILRSHKDEHKPITLLGLNGIIKFRRTKMNAQSIKAWVDTRNEPSIRLMKHLGFKQIELIKNADEFKGSMSDEFVFELETNAQKPLPALKKEYYAVIFSSYRRPTDLEAYETMAKKVLALAKEQKGFLGVESVRESEGFGITVSYWESEEDIKSWKANGEHRLAQELGRGQWYESFVTRVCKVERDYSHSKSEGSSI